MSPVLPFQLDAGSAVEWLTAQGLLAPGEVAQVEALTGGVSSTVLKVALAERALVLKQPLPQLKVRDPWEIGLERIFIERDFMLAMQRIGLGAYVPGVIACDDEAHILAMDCIDPCARVWKQALMAGEAPEWVARQAGELLARLQNLTRDQPALLRAFESPWVFEQGRLEPYYHTAARAHDDLQGALAEALDALRSGPRVLVHGDFSPKNMLFGAESALILLDHEIAHSGHPAFDPAFCLTHLCLKQICFPQARASNARNLRTFWQTYRSQLLDPQPERLEAEIVRHTGWVLLARADGKSPAEYASEADRAVIRELARAIILERIESVPALLRALESRLGPTCPSTGKD